ncbi:hypothetical protein ACFQ0D_26505 [Micromonospora zhanjiangensis]
MRAGELLRQLDRRLLPPLARGMIRLGQGRIRLQVLTGTALLSSVAVLVTAVWAADRRPVGDPSVGDVTRVGVSDGQSIPGYVASSRERLRALLAAPPTGPETETYALVTMAAYLAPERLTPALGGVAVSEVFSRVRLPDVQTQIVRIPALTVPDDVLAGMAELADRKDREARDYQRRSAAVTGDGEHERRMRAYYTSGARVAEQEATAYRSRCSCVYAAVARADPAVLSRMAARPEVRVVDPAPEVSRLDRAVFTPPLPEQQDVVRPPADTGLPSASDGGAAPLVPPGTGPYPGTWPYPGTGSYPVPGTGEPSGSGSVPVSPGDPTPGDPTPRGSSPGTSSPEPTDSAGATTPAGDSSPRFGTDSPPPPSSGPPSTGS